MTSPAVGVLPVFKHASNRPSGSAASASLAACSAGSLLTYELVAVAASVDSVGEGEGEDSPKQARKLWPRHNRSADRTPHVK